LANPDIEVTGLCDVDREALQDMVKRFGLVVEQYETVEKFMENGRFDVVDICTPGATHFELAREALSRGFHVLVEKPPSLSAADVRALSDLADAKGLKIATVLSSRYREQYLAIRSAKEHGDLGRIVKVHAIHHANLVLSESPALWDETESKYLIYEFGIHLLDLMVDLCGPHSKVLFVNPIYNGAINSTTDIQVCILFESDAVWPTGYYLRFDPAFVILHAFLRVRDRHGCICTLFSTLFSIGCRTTQSTGNPEGGVEVLWVSGSKNSYRAISVITK
jgi:predicted dehydrogenase